MAYRSYHNPTDVTFAGTPLTGVVSIRWRTDGREVVDWGDDDVAAGVARYDRETTRGELRLIDIEAACGVAQRRGTLSFTAAHTERQCDLQISIADCSLGSVETEVSRGGVSQARISFVAEGTVQLTAAG